MPSGRMDANVPELPDIEAYLAALRPRVVGRALSRIRVASPFVLRTVDPPVKEAEGARVVAVRRVGKRVAFELENGVFVVLHLMIAGRLKWAKPGTKGGLVSFDFDEGVLVFTEAGSKHRASLHLARSLAEFESGAVEPLECDVEAFEAALKRENRTVKRALTDPRVVSGIGNAYSDELLHRAKMSPFQLTGKLERDEVERLLAATRVVLLEWSAKLVAQAQKAWPTKVTAFQPGFAVHGKFGSPCPVCGTSVQRIVRGEHEANYCPRCQTGGKLLADRALSKLLHDDWPSTIEEWEERRMPGGRSQARAGKDISGSTSVDEPGRPTH